MRAGDSILKRCLVLSLLVIHLFIAATYILYLPKYNPLRPASNYTRIKTRRVLKPTHQVKNNAANILVLIHRAYRSAIENKREMFSGLLQSGLVFVSLIIGGITILRLMRTSERAVKLIRPQQYAYLNYCTLRIWCILLRYPLTPLQNWIPLDALHHSFIYYWKT